MHNLKETILKHGIQNCMFIVPMRPVKTAVGFIHYTSSSDTPVDVPAVISEERYPISDGYKITLKSIYPLFGKEHFYLTDLSYMIKDGVVKFFVKPE